MLAKAMGLRSRLNSRLASALPSWMVRQYFEQREASALARLSRRPVRTEVFGRTRDVDVGAIMRDPELEAQWRRLVRELPDLGIEDGACGINRGDRRAVYYLVRKLRPRRVLEIGTHVAASTTYLATALRGVRDELGGDVELVTVDIQDVNAPDGWWKRMGCAYRPADIMRMIGCEDFVTFVTQASRSFLAETAAEFDLIFLDGHHGASTVYEEIPAASARLAPGGFVLLHDYFPDNVPLWDNGVVIPGPHLAFTRLRAEANPLDVRPLGELPWATKLGSRVTSLALLGRV